MSNDAPPAFFCPISMELMRDPVSTVDGHCYERAAIERWFEGSRTSPKTGARLSSTTVIPSYVTHVINLDTQGSFVKLSTLVASSAKTGRPFVCICNTLVIAFFLHVK